MELNARQVLLWLILMVPIDSRDPMASFDTVNSMEDERYDPSDFDAGSEPSCQSIKPKSMEIVQRIYALMPYFDKHHANAGFLHRMRGTINSMSDAPDVLDREAAYFAAVLTPVVFLQSRSDTWCLLERFHRAMRFYQVSHPTEKRAALKLLQNLRSVISKITMFVQQLHGPRSETDPSDREISNNIRFMKELIKNIE